MRSTGFINNFVDFWGTQIVLLPSFKGTTVILVARSILKEFLNATNLGYAFKAKVAVNPSHNSFFYFSLLKSHQW